MKDKVIFEKGDKSFKKKWENILIGQLKKNTQTYYSNNQVIVLDSD